jgi:plastocyanin
MRRSPMVLAVVIGLLVGAGVVGVLVTADDDTTSVTANLPKPPVATGRDGGRTPNAPSGTTNSQACASVAKATGDASGENQALLVEVCARPSTVRPGQAVTFSLQAQDPDAAIDTSGCQQPLARFGDEDDGGAVRCESICVREDYPPEAATFGHTYTHTYATPGTYTASFAIGSCAPHASSGTAEVRITVSG